MARYRIENGEGDFIIEVPYPGSSYCSGTCQYLELVKDSAPPIASCTIFNRCNWLVLLNGAYYPQRCLLCLRSILGKPE